MPCVPEANLSGPYCPRDGAEQGSDAMRDLGYHYNAKCICPRHRHRFWFGRNAGASQNEYARRQRHLNAVHLELKGCIEKRAVEKACNSSQAGADAVHLVNLAVRRCRDCETSLV
jgi:hypothetical protein